MQQSYDVQGAVILQELRTFYNQLRAEITGSKESLDGLSTQEMSGGANIARLLHENFGTEVDKLPYNHNLSRIEMYTVMCNASGARPSLFVNLDAFEELVKRQVELFQHPCDDCVVAVHEQILRIVDRVSVCTMCMYVSS